MSKKSKRSNSSSKRNRKRLSQKNRESRFGKRPQLTPLLEAPQVIALPTPTKKTRFRTWLRNYLPLMLGVLGLNLFVLGAIYFAYHRTILSFQVSPVVTAEMHLRTALPTRITIPSVKIDKEIQEAKIEDGIWQTSDHNATHLDTSAHPGEGNNIVIYGHNLWKIFGPLRNVKKDDVIEVSTQDNKVHEYIVDTISVVSPNQIEKVLPTDHEVLTVYTCTGFLDSKRLVISAIPSRVRSVN